MILWKMNFLTVVIALLGLVALLSVRADPIVLELGSYAAASCAGTRTQTVHYNPSGACFKTSDISSYRATCGSGVTIFFGAGDCTGTSGTTGVGCIASPEGLGSTSVGCKEGNFYSAMGTGLQGTCTADFKLPSTVVFESTITSSIGTCMVSASLGFSAEIDHLLNNGTAAVVKFYNPGACSDVSLVGNATIEFGKCFQNMVNQQPTIIAGTSSATNLAVATAAVVAFLATISSVAF